RGIKTVAVTAGYVCDEPRRDLFAHLDAANVDLKAFDDDFYTVVCGGRLQPVLDTLCYLRHETEVWFEITTLLIPGKNDSDEELHAASRWVVDHLGHDVPWHFTAFHPDYRMRSLPPTPLAVLQRARAIAEGHGVHYVYTGNVHDERGGATRCQGCGEILIGRDGYALTRWNLTERGHCRACNTPCVGVFEGPPGDWGARRMPVRLADFAGGPV
ncbi:MAG: AmmeMemoRadiSam system radical SAM enzyme, partial [Myxococcota bacterium]